MKFLFNMTHMTTHMTKVKSSSNHQGMAGSLFSDFVDLSPKEAHLCRHPVGKWLLKFIKFLYIHFSSNLRRFHSLTVY